MIWIAIVCALVILCWPVSLVVAYVHGHREGVAENEKQHEAERVLREENFRKRTVTSSAVGNDGHASVKSARFRRK